MTLVLGEILIDRFPTYNRVGGAPFNFAVHLHRFGLPVRFFSRVGRDEAGEEILHLVKTLGLNPGDIQVDPNLPTGAVDVSLDARGVPEFDILPERAYDRIDPEEAEKLLTLGAFRLVYYGTLIQRTAAGFETVQNLLRRRSAGCRAFCDLNLRPRCYNDRVLLASLQGADILKLSEEEAETAAALGYPLTKLTESGKIVLVTRGAAGSDFLSRETCKTIRSEPLSSVEDTVGAGDAYAAAAAFGLLNGAPPEKVLSGASTFAAAVCGCKGALPEDLTVYDEVRRIYDR